MAAQGSPAITVCSPKRGAFAAGNKARWSARAAARVLLGLLVATFAPSGPVVIGVDDTLERRWGKRITARGIYRDPVRSSHGHFVKASGLR
jgi:hypothetical protein